MRKIIALIFISLITLSCSNELVFNTPSLQGTKNYELWRANNYQATLSDNGGIKIIGTNNNESLAISISSFNVGTYNLKSSSINTVVFEDNNMKSYSTSNNGDGEIVIEDYDSTKLTITGTFKFNAYSDNKDVINFIQGVFYKIPIAAIPIGFTGSNLFNATVNSDAPEVDTIETTNSEGITHVKAIYLDNTTIEFFIPEDIQVGSHTLNANTQTYASYVFANGVVAASQYGTLTILEHDTQFKKIKASFLFNTGNPHNISVANGNFVVFY